MKAILMSFVALAIGLSQAARAEQPVAPMWQLAEAAFQLEVTVLSVEEKPLTERITNIWHRVKVKRVFVGTGLNVGDELAVVSQVFDNPPGATSSSGDHGPFNGPNGLPAKGDHARIFANGSAKVLKTISPNGWQLPDHMIAFIATDDECRSDVTMPFIANLIARQGIARTRVHFSTGDDGRGSSATAPDMKARTGLTDDLALRRADSSVLAMRRSELGNNQMMWFESVTRHGLPIVGFRNSLQAFGFPGDGQGATWWNDAFPVETWGTRWRSQCGRQSKTRIIAPDAEAGRHPVLSGVSIPAEGLVVPSSLFRVDPLPADCRVLLWGEAVDGNCPEAERRQPILWVRELPRRAGWLPPQRIAFTSLGHPADFLDAEVRLLCIQMIAWAIGEESRMDDSARLTIRTAQYLPPEVQPPATAEP
ncbi:MAG: hypothetical protein FGM37_05760 [Phycisphaerales bacterium]|nr:hypothetical protein [Phycisphaerales bacterium]